MKTIWEYPVPFDSHFTLELPAGAEMLAVQMQLDMPTLWVLVKPTAPKVETNFRWYPTGGDSCSDHDTKAKHVGTVQWKNLVLHLFRA